MELWFWLAVAAAVLGGIPSFTMKVAAHRDYNSELFVLYSAIVAVVLVLPVTLVLASPAEFNTWLMAVAFCNGMVAALGGIFRINALKFIDTTIYYPLVKLLTPLLVIVAGVALFAEQFTLVEWVGLLAGVFVPVMLVTKAEHGRQKNLVQGLILVIVTGVIAALVALVNKYVVDAYGAILWMLLATTVGVMVGSIFYVIYKQGVRNLKYYMRTDTTRELVQLAALRAVFILISFGSFLYALSFGGTISIVYTIHSLYILVPIVLAVIFYKEHWNTQKAIAVVLSILALALLR